MIVGELVPKSLALQDPTRTALLTVLPMQWSLRAFAWSIALLNGSGALLLRLLRRRRRPAIATCTRPRRSSCSSPRAATAGCSSRRSRCGCTARCGSACAPRKQLMVPRARLAALDAATPFAEVLRLVATSPYSRLPVYRGTLDHVIGILHTKDVVLDFVSDRPRRIARGAAPADPARARDHAGRSPAGVPARAAQPPGLVVDDDGRIVRPDHARGRPRRAARRRGRRVQGRAAARDSPAGRPGAAAGCDAARSGGAGGRRVAGPQRHRRRAHRRPRWAACRSRASASRSRAWTSRSRSSRAATSRR